MVSVGEAGKRWRGRLFAGIVRPILHSHARMRCAVMTVQSAITDGCQRTGRFGSQPQINGQVFCGETRQKSRWLPIVLSESCGRTNPGKKCHSTVGTWYLSMGQLRCSPALSSVMVLLDGRCIWNGADSRGQKRNGWLAQRWARSFR